jgi:hypothetical protein
MVAANPTYRLLFASSKPVPPANYLTEHVRRYFDRQAEVSRAAFVRDVLPRESRFRSRKDQGNGRWHARLESPGILPLSASRPPLTEADIRIHAWLNERLAALHHQRHGLWSKIRRLLFGS